MNVTTRNGNKIMTTLEGKPCLGVAVSIHFVGRCSEIFQTLSVTSPRVISCYLTC